MRVKLREVVDVDSPISLPKLSPSQKILVSLQHAWRNTKIYKLKQEQRNEKEHKQRTMQEEKLKEILLTRIYGELVKNNKLQEYNLLCGSMVLTVSRDLEEVLREVITHKDFISFDIKFWECNNDLLAAFEKIPIAIEVRAKVVGGDMIEKV